MKFLVAVTFLLNSKVFKTKEMEVENLENLIEKCERYVKCEVQDREVASKLIYKFSNVRKVV